MRPLIRKEVEATLEELEKAQFVRKTEEGYKLLTVQEKNWETRRNGLDPREADRNRIHREMISDIFTEPKVRTHNYKNLRSFRLGVTLEGENVEADGEVMLIGQRQILCRLHKRENRSGSGCRRQRLWRTWAHGWTR